MTTVALRLVFGALIIAAGQAGIHLVSDWGMPQHGRPAAHRARELPQRLGAWASETEADPLFAENLGTEDSTDRIYRRASGDAVALHMAVWEDFHLTPPHLPEVCYGSAGYEVVDRKLVELKQADGATAPAVLLTFRQKSESLLVLYWYQLGGTVVLDRDGMRRARQQMRHADAWAPTVKVMLQSSGEDLGKTAQSMLDLAQRAYGWSKDL